jgi:UDP:flavonoid glycosyltransferase YjiC (YdhE family)
MSSRARNILIVAMGSHGDTHPFIGLGQVLRRRGHRVTLLANGVFESLINRAGLNFVGLSTAEEYHELIKNPDLWHPSRGFPVVMNAALESARRQIERLTPLIEPQNTILIGSSIALGARLGRETFAVPTVMVHLQPIMMRSVEAPPIFGGLPLPRHAPRWLNRLIFGLIDWAIINRTVLPRLNSLAAELGLSPVKDFMTWVHSPDLTIGLWPDWFGPRQKDWPASVRLTGFPLYDENDIEPIPAAVEKFLGDGPPPVVFTPGSAMRFGHEFFAAAAGACARVNRRAILLTRYKEQIPAALPAGVIHADYVPLSLLLPRAAAMVHHGGIGTMSQALASGVPQIVMPMGHDQFDNADRACRLGLSRTIAVKHFSSANLAKALELILGNPAAGAAARGVADRFKNKQPLEETASAVEGLNR